MGINTDRPDEPLTIHGNIKLTGHIVQPSDARIKTDIREVDTHADAISHWSSLSYLTVSFNSDKELLRKIHH